MNPTGQGGIAVSAEVPGCLAAASQTHDDRSHTGPPAPPLKGSPGEQRAGLAAVPDAMGAGEALARRDLAPIPVDAGDRSDPERRIDGLEQHGGNVPVARNRDHRSHPLWRIPRGTGRRTIVVAHEPVAIDRGSPGGRG